MNPEIDERAARLRRERVPFVHARVVRAERPTSAKAGDQAVVLPDGSIEGFVGGACAESTVRAQSLSLLDSGEPLLLRISPPAPGAREPGVAGATAADADSPPGTAGGPAAPAGGADETPRGTANVPAGRADDPPGTLSVVNRCQSGGTLEIFLEPVVPAPTVAVHGDSPIAAALVALANGVGFQGVRGTDPAGPDPGPDGPVAVVVASHGRDEERALAAAVRAGVPYVGLVASRKRGEAVVAGLDLDEAQQAAIHTPAGLDIGARTPREVALSILAEIVSLRPRPSAVAAGSPPGSGRTSAVADPTDDAGVADPPSGAHRRPPVPATDLVCGMSVVADEASLHLDHGGERYWFCGSGCLRAFAADPGAYLPTRTPPPPAG